MKTLAKIFFGAVLLLICCAAIHAQAPQKNTPLRVYRADQLDAHLGIGILPTYLADRKRSVQTFPAVYTALDYRLTKNFSLGAYYGRSESQTDEYIFSDGVRGSWTNRTQTYGLRAAFHIDRLKNTDLYGGFTVGRTQSLIDCTDPTMKRMEQYMGIENVNAKTVFSAFLGGRYAVTKRLGAFAEIGAGGVALARAGLSYQLF